MKRRRVRAAGAGAAALSNATSLDAAGDLQEKPSAVVEG